MTDAARRRVWRLGTVLPAVLTAVAGVAAAAVVGAGHTPVQPADFTDRSPLASLDSMYQIPGGVRAIGWDFDPDAPTTPVRTFATVDHKWVNTTVASLPRPDVATAHPHAGANHGFKWFVPVPEGKHVVCIDAKNIGAGATLNLTCRTMTLDYGPFGAFESLRAGAGSISVRGWAVDSDTVSAPVTMTITVDATPHVVIADDPRPDIANVRKGAGPNHGFAAAYKVAQGKHTVCVTGKNIGFGTDNTIACKTITLNESPVGAIDVIARAKDKVHVQGWAFDPDAPTQSLTVTLTVDHAAQSVVAKVARSDVAATHPAAGKFHGFDLSLPLAEGSHTICISARNVSFGSNLALGCRAVVLNFTPTASVAPLSATRTGLKLSGWATDPDTNAPVSVRISLDGHTVSTVAANAKGTVHSGHDFAMALPTTSGKHAVCAVALNIVYGHSNSPSACRTITLALKPIGRFDSISRASGSSDLSVIGWALDPDTTAPLSISLTMDGHLHRTLTASANRNDVGRVYPASGPAHGIASVVLADAGEHTVCLIAKNVGGGSGDTSLGCKLIIAVHPTAPSVPLSVTALAGYGGATVIWTPPASDGGAPWSNYVVTASPGGQSVMVSPTATSATVTGLKSKTTYSFTVTATNVAGTSPVATTPAVTTQATPPPQTTPAPVSTSRYIRNVRGATSADLAAMRAEGAADAKANPSGHGYLILLDIGGQDQYDGGVILSATTHFVSYSDLAKDLNAYVAGYSSRQKASAPITIAVGANNDLDVSASSGKAWATQVVNPLKRYATRYPGITIAGANDIEPGFRATYSQTKAWLKGYLGATTAPFVFNGSADGCAWTVTNRGCNNGWTMAGLYYLAAGAAPIRMLNLPQIYNTTMAGQWKYISLTGVGNRQPRINFGGTLTEWTACAQSNSCGSLTGHSAWAAMWNNLQSDTRLKVSSLPYSTDLRIDT
jgi:hypothetical protein